MLVLQYLDDIADVGQFYNGCKSVQTIQGFYVADRVGQMLGRLPTSGYFPIAFGATVSKKFKKSSDVTALSAEPEYLKLETAARYCIRFWREVSFTDGSRI